MGRLMKRDREILKHIARYRLTTDDVLLQLFFEHTEYQNAIDRVMKRLARQGWVRSYAYRGTSKYHMLGLKAARLLDAPHFPRPFTEQTLPALVAVLCYCMRFGVKRIPERLFEKDFPSLCFPEFSGVSYYANNTIDPPRNRLHLIIVDRNNTIRRLNRVISDALVRRYRMASFRDLIQQNYFALTLVTTSERRKRFIEGKLEDHGRMVPIRVRVVPEYAPLLGSDVSQQGRRR